MQQVADAAVEGYFSETYDNFDALQCGDFCSEVLAAVADLLWERFISGRSAADDGADPCVTKFEAIVACDGSGFAGEAEVVQDGVHEVAGSVSSEGAACAVGPMRTGSETNDEDPSARVSEARDGAGPVGLVLVGAAASLTDALAVGAEARAKFTADDGVLNLLEDQGRRLDGGAFDHQNMISID